MKAITTTFHGPIDFKGSRIKAPDSDHNQVTVSYDHALSPEQNHDAAAIALCRKMGWTGHDLMRGGLGAKGNVYVFAAPMNLVKVTANS